MNCLAFIDTSFRILIIDTPVSDSKSKNNCWYFLSLDALQEHNICCSYYGTSEQIAPLNFKVIFNRKTL